jgi:hypothetical protein
MPSATRDRVTTLATRAPARATLLISTPRPKAAMEMIVNPLAVCDAGATTNRGRRPKDLMLARLRNPMMNHGMRI